MEKSLCTRVKRVTFWHLKFSIRFCAVLVRDFALSGNNFCLQIGNALLVVCYVGSTNRINASVFLDHVRPVLGEAEHAEAVGHVHDGPEVLRERGDAGAVVLQVVHGHRALRRRGIRSSLFNSGC